MVRLSEFLVSLFLIIIILLQIPQESIGLSSLASNRQFGSSRSFRRFIEILTAVCILVYFRLAFQLNIINN